jgi:hypothetical protein
MPRNALSDEQLDALFDSTSDRQILSGPEIGRARQALGEAIVAGLEVNPGVEQRRRAPAGRARPLRARFLVFGAVACGLAGAGLVVAALLPGQSLRSVRVGPIAQTPAPASAATVLEGLARTAYREPSATLGKGQLEYVSTIQGITTGGFAADAQGQLVGIRFVQTFTVQTWGNVKGVRRDRQANFRERFFSAADRAIASSHGMTLAQLDNTDAGANDVDDLIYPARDPAGPSGLRVDPFYTWPTLPTQPVALLKALKRELEKEGPARPTAMGVFSLISNGLLFNATSPALRSALYKVLAHLPGVELLGDRRDPLGRRGVAIAIHGHRSPGFVTLFDPSTATELETEMVNRSPSRNPHIPTIPRGTAETYTVFIRRGIVNSISEIPGGGHISTRGVPTVTYETRTS